MNDALRRLAFTFQAEDAVRVDDAKVLGEQIALVVDVPVREDVLRIFQAVDDDQACRPEPHLVDVAEAFFHQEHEIRLRDALSCQAAIVQEVSEQELRRNAGNGASQGEIGRFEVIAEQRKQNNGDGKCHGQHACANDDSTC